MIRIRSDGFGSVPLSPAARPPDNPIEIAPPKSKSLLRMQQEPNGSLARPCQRGAILLDCMQPRVGRPEGRMVPFFVQIKLSARPVLRRCEQRSRMPSCLGNLLDRREISICWLSSTSRTRPTIGHL